MMFNFPQLPVSKIQLRFGYAPPIGLPAYAGSAWRGALGHALKQTVCVVRKTACTDCLLRYNCAYPYLFETPPPPNSTKMRRYEAAPHPFVLDLHTWSDTENVEGVYSLGLTLFGHGFRYLPYFIHAFTKAGHTGLGKWHQPFALTDVLQLDGEGELQVIYRDGKLTAHAKPSLIALPPCPERLTIRLLTPLRIKQEGQNLGRNELNFGSFFSNLQRRISMLSYFHTDTPLETDFKALTELAKHVPLLDADLYWRDWTRYSSRQQTKMQMGGLLGEFELAGDLDLFWPYLWLGQWTHVGKGTSMGLGAYRIETARSLQIKPE